jgi:hypothetical protein
MKKLLVILLLLTANAYAFTEPVDSRYCGTPKYDATGGIHRSASEIARFKLVHPCPANGNKSGACPGWDIDHVIPLACGGCDAINNMQWLPHQYKITGKDRWERKINAKGVPNTPSCVNEIIK